MTLDDIDFEARYREIGGDGTAWKISGLVDSPGRDWKGQHAPVIVQVYLTSTNRVDAEKENRSLTSTRFLRTYERIPQ